ncbi:MAG: discoidin domain-containing protein, partial [Anaerolineae bacterium]|nr:discoidin domain-containing protein [Anaerolineae bacterium]
YFYRLQGTDEAGNFYVSPVYSFRTPEESSETTDNLLSPENGASVIEVSSNFGGQPIEGSTWGAANAFDDDPNTAWSSDGDGNDAHVTVQLGQPAQINEISFWTRTMSNDTSQIYSFTVTTETGDVYGPFELPDPDGAYTFEVDFTAETLRFDVVDSNGGNTGAVDIAAYGEPLER